MIPLREPGSVSRLLGFRWIVRAEDHALLSVPWWLPTSIVREAVAKVTDDFKLRHGKHARVTHGRRLILFDARERA